MNLTLLNLVVCILGVALLLCLGGVVYLLANQQPVDDTLKITISAIIGGLLGLLAPSREAVRSV